LGEICSKTSGHSGEVHTPTDTVVSGTATYLGIQGMQPFVSLNANLPSGKSALFGNAVNARMDPDLVDVSTFGEGYNVGPSLGFNFPITGSLFITTSVGYTWHGNFTRETESPAFPAGTDPQVIAELTPLAPTQTISPGQNVAYTAAVNYQIGRLTAGLTGSTTWETATAIDRIKSFQPGLRYLLALQSSFTWPEKFGRTSLSASFAHSNRNRVKLFLDEINAFGLVTEFLDSNSNVYRVGLEHLFPVGDLQIGPTGSVLYRDRNGYNADTLQFVPPKTRWSAGLLAQFAPNAAMTLNARFERVWTHENENPATDGGKIDPIAGGVIPSSTVPAISGAGWQTSFGLNIKM